MSRKLLLPALAVLLAVSACGTTSENSGQGPATSSAAACKGAGGKYTIGVSQANLAEPYRQQMDDDIQRAAQKVPQFTVNFADAMQDNAKQVSDVENFLTQQIDLLIISPNEAKKILVDCGKTEKTQLLQTQLVTQANAAEVYAKGNS